MVFKAKKKGSDFERLAVEILNVGVHKSIWKKIPGSGAIGTTMDEPSLTGDINGKVASFNKPFKVEAKVGYGGAKQLSLKKEWLDKIAEEAKESNSIPIMVGKFSGAKSGVKVFVAMDIVTFCSILNRATELHDEVESDG